MLLLLFKSAGGAAQALAGAPAGVSTAAGALSVAHSLAATSAGVSTAAGATSVARALSGASAGVSTATGAATMALSLAGAPAGVSTASGAATMAWALSGASAGVSTAAAALTTDGAIALVTTDSRTISPGIYDVRTMAMARRGVRITDTLIHGDDWRFSRTYTDMPTGITFSTWYLTIKSSETEADPGDIQVSITSSAGAAGQITDDTTAGGSVAGYFNVADTVTDDLTVDQQYFYDIQGITSTGAIYTFETGVLYPRRGYTGATS